LHTFESQRGATGDRLHTRRRRKSPGRLRCLDSRQVGCKLYRSCAAAAASAAAAARESRRVMPGPGRARLQYREMRAGPGRISLVGNGIHHCSYILALLRSESPDIGNQLEGHDSARMLCVRKSVRENSVRPMALHPKRLRFGVQAHKDWRRRPGLLRRMPTGPDWSLTSGTRRHPARDSMTRIAPGRRRSRP
jgi:hypothetical protein